MSIVRIGLSETQKFAEGYEAIFGKKQPAARKTERTGGKSAHRKKSKAKKK